MDKYEALVFFFSFVVDLLLLRGAARDDGSWIQRLRAVAAAAIGAGYNFLALRNEQIHMLLPVLLMMGVIAFGIGNFKCWGKFLFLWLVANAMAAGVTQGGGWFLVLGTALLCLLALVGHDGGSGKGFTDVIIQYGGQQVCFRALRDNGNLLKDPITGESVLIVSPWVGSKLLGLSPKELMQSVETVASGKVAGLRLIPYNAVGQPNGLLLAMRFYDVVMDGSKTTRMVAFSPNPIGDGKRFEALAGGAA